MRFVSHCAIRLNMTLASKSLQTSHIGPAILHEMEKYPVRTLDLASLVTGSEIRSVDEMCVHILQEATRVTPSILYLPNVGVFWDTVSPSVQRTFLSLILSLPPEVELLLLATAEQPMSSLPMEVQLLFSDPSAVVTGEGEGACAAPHIGYLLLGVCALSLTSC